MVTIKKLKKVIAEFEAIVDSRALDGRRLRGDGLGLHVGNHIYKTIKPIIDKWNSVLEAANDGNESTLMIDEEEYRKVLFFIRNADDMITCAYHWYFFNVFKNDSSFKYSKVLYNLIAAAENGRSYIKEATVKHEFKKLSRNQISKDKDEDAYFYDLYCLLEHIEDTYLNHIREVKNMKDIKTSETTVDTYTTAASISKTDEVVTEAYVDRIENVEKGTDKAVMYFSEDDEKVVIPLSMLPKGVKPDDSLIIKVSINESED